MDPIAKETATGITLCIYALPGSSRDEFVGVHDGKLKVKITAKSVEGAANKALQSFLAAQFGVSKTSVTIIRGEHCRDKLVGIIGDAKSLMRCLQSTLDRE
jgi:hypothetical protein